MIIKKKVFVSDYWDNEQYEDGEKRALEKLNLFIEGKDISIITIHHIDNAPRSGYDNYPDGEVGFMIIYSEPPS